MSEFENAMREAFRLFYREELAAQKKAEAYLTVEQYAKRWQISASTVRHAIAENRLVVIRQGRAVRIAADARIAPAADRHRDRVSSRLLGRTR